MRPVRESARANIGIPPSGLSGHPQMHVEFLGIPRERAGIPELEIDADTFGELLRTLVARVPALSGLVTADGLHPSIVANLNGDARPDLLVADAAEPMEWQPRERDDAAAAERLGPAGTALDPQRSALDEDECPDPI